MCGPFPDTSTARRPVRLADQAVRLVLVALAGSWLACSSPSPPPEPVAPAATTGDPEKATSEPSRTFDEWRAALLACPADPVWDEAIREFKQLETLEALAKIADEAQASCPDRWEPQWAAGEVLFERDSRPSPGSLEAMASRWGKALETASAAGQPAGISRACSRLSRYRRLTGDFPAAEELARRALATAIDARREELQVHAYSALAAIFYGQARFEEAVDALASAEELQQRAGNEEDAIKLRYNRAVLLEDLGQLAREQVLMEQVYADAVKLRAPDYSERAAVAMGNLHLLYGEFDVARGWFEKVRDGGPQEPRVALGLGRIALRRGRYDEALQHLDEAVMPSNPAFNLWSRRVEAQAQLLSGRPEAAVATLEGVIEEARAMGTSDTEAAAHALMARCRIALGHPREALPSLRRAVALIENSGAGLKPADGMNFLRERYEPYVELAAVLAEGDDPPVDEILRIIESAHARALRQLVGNGGTEATKPPSIGVLQASLAPRQMLLDYLIGDTRGVVVVLTRTETRVKLIPGWETMREAIGAYRAALIRPLHSAEARIDPMRDLRRDLEPGRRLRAWLLGEVEDLVASSERLYIVPDQDLALLPFVALPDENDVFLGEQLEVANLPLAAVRNHPAGRRGPLLFAGDPVGNIEAEFGPLPTAAAELDAIGDVWRAETTTRIDGADLTSERLRQLPLRDFRTLHLATHAVASSRDPLRCAVILSAGDRLGVRELVEMRLGPGLVVLSACRTGGGEIVPGEGVVGLTWAFLQAGAREVVASLWTVEDEATKYLMVAFHESLRAGADPVTALHRAQEVTRSARPHPVFWAPFVVVLSPAGD